MKYREEKEVEIGVAGFGLAVALPDDVTPPDACEMGPVGQVYQFPDGTWTWKVEGFNCKSKEQARTEMRAAIDGAIVLKGLDRRGLPVERRKSSK